MTRTDEPIRRAVVHLASCLRHFRAKEVIRLDVGGSLSLEQRYYIYYSLAKIVHRESEWIA